MALPRLLPFLLLVGVLNLQEVEADAVADAASSQVDFLGLTLLLTLPDLSNSKTKVEINNLLEAKLQRRSSFCV